MADQLYIPTVPVLGADNTVDLDALGSEALKTLIRYDGIENGDLIYPNWRGCGPDGSVHDFADAAVPVEENLIEPDGMPIEISNTLLKSLDQGWVFYSFTFEKGGVISDESPRLFFYVGKRALIAGGLAVAQLRDAHDLYLDADVLENEVIIAIPPYENMTVDDKVIFKWVGQSSSGTIRDPIEVTTVLTKDQPGKPLLVSVARSQVLIIKGGQADVSYKVIYPDSARPSTDSPIQTIKIAAPTTALLPAIEIPGVAGFLDPGLYEDGLKLIINNYPLIQAGDNVMLYALAKVAGVDEILTLRVDESIVDRGTFTFTVDADWLNTNSGLDVSFAYHFSRLGAEGASEPLTVNISKKRDLVAPNIPLATSEGVAKGSVNIKAALDGIKVEVPSIVATDTVRVRWDAGADKSELLDPDDETKKLFTVPAKLIAPYIGKRLCVRYEITPSGSSMTLNSTAYDLGFTDLVSTDFTPASCTKPPSSGTLSIQAVKATGGAEFTQTPWPLFFEGQLMRMTAVAGASIYYLRGTKEKGLPVTSGEVSAKKIIAALPVSFVESLSVNSTLSVYSEVSYDGGAVYKKFQAITLTLKA